MSSPIRDHQALIAALHNPGFYPHPVDKVTLLETHISSVLLAGDFAYKLKKPYDLGFLDFTSLAKRKHFCEEELRLNRRFSPDLYLEVVPITGSHEAPTLGGDGPAIEYAVKMRRFPPGSLLPEVLAHKEISLPQIDRLAQDVAEFLGSVAVAPAHSPFGSPASIRAHAAQNFEQIRPLLASDAQRAELNALADWTEQALQRLAPVFARRQAQGFVRECHGDMHAGNMAVIDGRIRLFDCIEFNEAFRWIDIMSETAFFVMDMVNLERSDIGFRFLNAYLEQTGDYEGLTVLPYYLVFRAVVRAKVAALGGAQAGIREQACRGAWRSYQHYMDLARRFYRGASPWLIVMHGLSGSGKSSVAALLAEQLGAIRIRSDVERKRLYGLKPLDKSAAAIAGGIYTPEATQRTYARLHQVADAVLRAGFPVILDATYLRHDERDAARAVAQAGGWPCIVLVCSAAPEELRRRVSARTAAGKDAAEADLNVLERQFGWVEGITPEETALTLQTDGDWTAQELLQRLRALVAP